MKSVLKSSLTALAVLALSAGGAVAADHGVASFSEFDTVPNSDTGNPAGTLGDLWEVEIAASGTFTISLDTRDDFGNNTSGLDPIMFVLNEAGSVIASADDNMTCNEPMVCNFSCPTVTISLSAGDEISVLARDFNSAVTGGGTQCNGGAYTFSISSTDGGLIDEAELELDDKRVGGDYSLGDVLHALGVAEGNPGKYY